MADARRRRFDLIAVAALDRLGRNLRHLVTLLDELQHLGVGLVSLREALDLTSPIGRAMYALVAVLAEVERAWIVERTHAGLRRANCARMVHIHFLCTRRVMSTLSRPWSWFDFPCHGRPGPGIWRECRRSKPMAGFFEEHLIRRRQTVDKSRRTKPLTHRPSALWGLYGVSGVDGGAETR